MTYRALTSLVVLAATLPTLVFANQVLNGPYIGFALGGMQTQTNTQTQSDGQVVVPGYGTFEGTNANDLESSGSSAMAALRFGYGQGLGTTPLYLGGEIFGSVAERESETSTSYREEASSWFFPWPGYIEYGHKETTLKMKDAEFGFDLRPGVFLSPTTLLYGRVGGAQNEMTLETTPSAFSDVSYSNTEDVIGVRLGFGLETAISPKWSLNFDYIYTDYGDITADFSPTLSDEFTGEEELLTETSADVINQSILFGFNYYPFAKSNQTSKTVHVHSRDSLNGFYSGVRAGALYLNNELDVSYTPQSEQYEDLEDYSATYDMRLWQNSPVGDVFFGYGRFVGNSKLYLAAELFGSVAQRQVETDYATNYALNTVPLTGAVDFSDEIDVNLSPFEWGGDIKIGRAMGNDGVFYARFGYGFNQVDINTKTHYTLVDNTHNTTYTGSFDASETQDVQAGRFGLGFEKMVWQNVAVAADW